MAAAEWALKQDEIKNDPNGQWAIQATASSTYNDAQGTAGWSANQATGPPNVDKYGDDGAAWTSKTPDGGIEWLDLKYPKSVHATEVRVRESCGSGTVIKVEVFDEQGGAHAIWQGNDPTTGLNYLMVKFPKTTFKTDRVKVTLATNVVPGWNEIDAVQLVGTLYFNVSTFSALREWNLALIGSTTEEGMAKTVNHPERGDMTFRTIVETMAGHDINHLNQLDAIVAGFAR